MDSDPSTISLLLSVTVAVVAVATTLRLFWFCGPTQPVQPRHQAGEVSAHRRTVKQVPFLTLRDPDWRDIGKALNTYERELDACLEGLSYSLEVCLQTERALGLNNGVLSSALRQKISTLAKLGDWNRDVLQGLLHDFPIRIMLPKESFRATLETTPFRPASTSSTATTQKPSQRTYGEPPPRTTSKHGIPESSSYDSVGQIVAHLVRDWTEEGQRVRQSVHDWCREQVRGYAKTILVPGAGLGRLAWDLAQEGHSVEANEVSLTMAGVAHKLFHNEVEFVLYPFLTDMFVNEVNSSLRYQSVRVRPPKCGAMKGHLSYTIGDFVEIYGSPQSSKYDIVITCFFLDTATNVLTYLAIVSNLLAKGGQWIHVGPLQWHINALLHPSVDELRLLIQDFGFRIDQWSIDSTPVDYRMEDPTNIRFTKYEGYQPLRMVATKTKTDEQRFRILLPREVESEGLPVELAWKPPTSTVSIEELPSGDTEK